MEKTTLVFSFTFTSLYQKIQVMNIFVSSSSLISSCGLKTKQKVDFVNILYLIIIILFVFRAPGNK